MKIHEVNKSLKVDPYDFDADESESKFSPYSSEIVKPRRSKEVDSGYIGTEKLIMKFKKSKTYGEKPRSPRFFSCTKPKIEKLVKPSKISKSLGINQKKIKQNSTNGKKQGDICAELYQRSSSRALRNIVHKPFYNIETLAIKSNKVFKDLSNMYLTPVKKNVNVLNNNNNQNFILKNAMKFNNDTSSKNIKKMDMSYILYDKKLPSYLSPIVKVEKCDLMVKQFTSTPVSMFRNTKPKFKYEPVISPYTKIKDKLTHIRSLRPSIGKPQADECCPINNCNIIQSRGSLFDLYQKILISLHSSAIPKNLPCRDTEIATITHFLEQCINHRMGGCMYISGVPGTGKTAAVYQSLKNLGVRRNNSQSLSTSKSIKSPNASAKPVTIFIDLNGMKLRKASDIYVKMYQKIFCEISPQSSPIHKKPVRVSAEAARCALDGIFRPDQNISIPNSTNKQQHLRKLNLSAKKFRQTTIIVLIDEFDLICKTKSQQQIIYNLFDWPFANSSYDRNSHVCDASNSNFMDTMEEQDSEISIKNTNINNHITSNFHHDDNSYVSDDIDSTDSEPENSEFVKRITRQQRKKLETTPKHNNKNNISIKISKNGSGNYQNEFRNNVDTLTPKGRSNLKAYGPTLIILTIANTMDLPEKFLCGRVQSRLGLDRLTFQPYNHVQLQHIIESRLKHSCQQYAANIFSPDCLQLIARKVSALTGDARKALEICRRTLELCKDTFLEQPRHHQAHDSTNSLITAENLQNYSSKNVKTNQKYRKDSSKKLKTMPDSYPKYYIGMEQVQKALNEIYSSDRLMQNMINSLSLYQRLFLKVLASEVQDRNCEFAKLITVLEKFNTQCEIDGLCPINYTQCLRICDYLATLRICSLENSQNSKISNATCANTRSRRIRLNMFLIPTDINI